MNWIEVSVRSFISLERRLSFTLNSFLALSFTFCSAQSEEPKWQIVPNFNLMVAVTLFYEWAIQWTTLLGTSDEALVSDNEHLVREPLYYASGTSPPWVRDLKCFVGGEIHQNPYVWEKLTQHLPDRDEITGGISKKVCVRLCPAIKRKVLIPNSPCLDCFLTLTHVSLLLSSSYKP